MNNMVAGFLFDNDGTSVLVVKKDRPDWQKGKYNGIGGKVELGETALEAMIREFKEETGLTVLGWNRFCIMKGDDWTVHFFYAFEDYDFMNHAESGEEGEIHLLKTEWVFKHPRIANLDWLIPMALSMDDYWAKEFEIIEVT